MTVNNNQEEKKEKSLEDFLPGWMAGFSAGMFNLVPGFRQTARFMEEYYPTSDSFQASKRVGTAFMTLAYISASSAALYHCLK